MKNMNKKCYPLLLSAALLAGACNDAGQGESAAGGPVCVKTMAVAAPTGYAPDEYQGTVEEANGTDLSFATMGTVSSIRVNMGDRVAKGQLIATLDATTARSTHEAALGGKSYRATVTEKGVTANALSRSYDVRLKVDNADSRLLPGMVVSVTLSSRGATGYPVVPAGIVQIDERNKTFVWVVSDGKAARRDINCGEYVGDGVTVTSGLKAGERVIVEGSQKVCNGTKVKTI